MMIGIDGNEANQKVRVGSGVFAFELLKQFHKYYVSSIKYQVYLKDTPLRDLPAETDRWHYQIVRPKPFWTQIGLPVELWQEKLIGKVPDIFFTPNHYAPRFCPVPSVITIFDLSFLKFPEMFLPKDLYQLKNWTAYSIKQAKKIITISENSKNDIIKYYGIPENKIVVVYPGYDKQKFKIQNSNFKIDEIKKKHKIGGDYILYVGTIQPRKNLVRLIEAFSALKTTNYEPRTKNLKLVICGMIKEGRGGWMQEEIFKKVQSSKREPSGRVQSDIIFTGFVSDEDLPYLIAGAKTLVLPSLYEGFGIPVVEAMACGVPTVVSNISSLPEIVGDAGILVDPYDINSIARGVEEACYNETLRISLIRRGLQRVNKFNWEKSAVLILELLKTIAN